MVSSFSSFPKNSLKGKRRNFKFLRTCGEVVGGLTYSHFKILRLVVVSRLYGSLFMLLGLTKVFFGPLGKAYSTKHVGILVCIMILIYLVLFQ